MVRLTIKERAFCREYNHMLPNIDNEKLAERLGVSLVGLSTLSARLRKKTDMPKTDLAVALVISQGQIK